MLRRLSLGSLAAALVVTLSACGDEAEPSAGTEPTASTPASTPASNPPVEDPSTSPSTDAGPTESSEPAAPAVAPATGAELTSEIISIKAPAEFGDGVTPSEDGGTVIQVSNPRFFVFLSAGTTALDADTPDELVALGEGKGGATGEPKERLPDVLIDGQPAFHLAGADPTFDGWQDEFGFVYQGYNITITVNSALDTSQAERDATNAAVLASAELLQ